MALYRENPKCTKCGGIINGIYKDQNHLPLEQRIIGDTFLGWDWGGHKCEKSKSQEVTVYIKTMSGCYPLKKCLKGKTKDQMQAYYESLYPYAEIEVVTIEDEYENYLQDQADAQLSVMKDQGLV